MPHMQTQNPSLRGKPTTTHLEPYETYKLFSGTSCKDAHTLTVPILLRPRRQHNFGAYIKVIHAVCKERKRNRPTTILSATQVSRCRDTTSSSSDPVFYFFLGKGDNASAATAKQAVTQVGFVAGSLASRIKSINIH